MKSLHQYFRRLRTAQLPGVHDSTIPAISSEAFDSLPLLSKTMIEKIIADKRIEEDEVRLLKNILDPGVSPENSSIRLLFDIHDHVYGQPNDPAWNDFFLETALRFFTDEANDGGKLPLTKAYILYDQIKKSMDRTGLVSEEEMALLRKLSAMTGGISALNNPVNWDLQDLLREVLKDGTIDAKDIRMIRELIHENHPPEKEDIDLLYAVHLTLAEKTKDRQWEPFFVESVTAYVIGNPDDSPATRFGWLENKLKSTTEQYNALTPEELALIVTLQQQVTTLPPAIYQFIIDSSDNQDHCLL